MGKVQNVSKAAIRSFNDFMSKAEEAVFCWKIYQNGSRKPAIDNPNEIKQARGLAYTTIGLAESTLILLEKDSKRRRVYINQINCCKKFIDETN